jgi:hypothetical protein
VYDDWESALALLPPIDRRLRQAGLEAEVLFVDDGSEHLPAADATTLRPTAIRRILVLPLRRNLGHQRAIAIGLAHIEDHLPGRAVLVMDGDGEDSPDDIPRLVERLRETGQQKVIFAARTKRLEKPSFQVLYHAYRLLHRVLTGISVRVGNFSVLPASLLRRLVVVPELWSHYAAAVFASGIPHESIPTARAPRIAGRSKMSFAAQVAHGLTAIAVHGEQLSRRVLGGLMAAILLSTIALLAVLFLPPATDLGLPGWTVPALLVVIAWLLTLSVVFVFMIMRRRAGATFLPTRDYRYYADDPFDLIPTHVEQRAAR